MVRRLPGPPAAPVRDLDEIASIASARLQQNISRVAPRDAALTWKAAAVHPLQVLETEYQGIVHDAVRGIGNADLRKLVEGKALGQFYFFDAGSPRLLGVGQGEAYDGEKYPLIEDKLRALRKSLKEAGFLLPTAQGQRIDLPLLRRTLRVAFGLARRVRRGFLVLPGSDQWDVAPITAATRDLVGIDREIDQADTVPQFNNIIHRIESAAKHLAQAAEGLGSVQMFYVIEAFFLFRLLVRYKIESYRPLTDEVIAEASGALTDLMTNGHPWLSDWLRDKIVEISRRIARVDPSHNTLFFLKGGRALRYLEGNAAAGKNDWDTQIVINPLLPPAEWYDLFLRVSNEVLLALKEFNAELYMLLHGHAADLARELQEVQPPANVAPPGQRQLLDAVWDRIDLEALDDRLDVDEPLDQIPNRNKANCKAELIDIGLPRYDTIEALEQWRHLRTNIQVAGDGVPYPGALYYIAEYLMMIREVFAGKSHSLRKAPVRIERLYNMLNLPGVEELVAAHYGAAVQRRLPLSYAQVQQVADVPARRALLVMLSDFIVAYDLDKDAGFVGGGGQVAGFAQALDTVLAQAIPGQPQVAPYPPGVRELMENPNLQPGPLSLARAVCFGQQVSQWVEAHLQARGDFLRGQQVVVDQVLREFFGNSFFSNHEELEIQAAIRSSYGAWLQGSYVQSPRAADLDPTTYLSIGIYISNPDADPLSVFDLVAPIVDNCLMQPGVVGQFECTSDPGKRFIRLFWSQADTVIRFGGGAQASYAALAIELVIVPPPARPLLSYVWGLPTLGLRDMIGEYRSMTAEIEEYGRRQRLRETCDALIEIATRAASPERNNPTITAMRQGTGHHLMISSDSLAIGGGADYPPSFHQSNLALKLLLTGNRSALRRALTMTPAEPLVDRSLDLLVINQGHGGIGLFADWTSDELRDNIVRPLKASGVTANIIVLDFCVSASLIPVFAELCAPGGVIVSSLYSTVEVVMTTGFWKQIEDHLKHRDVAAILEAIEDRAKTMSAELTGYAHLESVRQWSEQQTSAYLRLNPFDTDAISIIRYLPLIADAFRDQQTLPAIVFEHLSEARGQRSMSLSDQAVLVGLPQDARAMTPEILELLRKQFRSRLVAILTPLLTEPLNLQDRPLFGQDSLWSMVLENRSRILSQAKGLLRCPAPMTVFFKDSARLMLDEAIAGEQIDQAVQNLLRVIDLSAPEDIAAILGMLFQQGAIAALDEVPNLFQP
jgi:hypothetical protein